MRSWGEPPWRRIEVPARPLENSTPEVAIIGGGLTGVAAAYHLARSGLRPVVLEAARVGDGASGRTGGIVLEGTARGIVAGADRCVPLLAELVREAAIDCDLKLPGCWEIAHRDDPAGEALPWKDDGHGVRIVRTVAGGTVDPMALLTQLARAAVGAGAVLHEQAEVRRLIIEPHPVEPHPVLELEGAVIRPRFVIVAVNAWTSHLLPSVRRVESSLTFACATEPLSDSTLDDLGLAHAIPFYTVDTPYLWGRETQDRRMIFGAGLTYARREELSGSTSTSPSRRRRLRAWKPGSAGYILRCAMCESRIVGEGLSGFRRAACRLSVVAASSRNPRRRWLFGAWSGAQRLDGTVFGARNREERVIPGLGTVVR